MMNTIEGLKSKFRNSSIVLKLIYINVSLFVITYAFRTVAFLFSSDNNLIVEWFALSGNIDHFLFKPWTLLSYSFLHAGLFHLISNMLILYFSGILFLEYFSEKRFLNYYLSGALSGGLIYIISYNYFPAFQSINSTSILVGASASVMAIVVGIATYIPHYAIRLFFFGSVKLQTIALVLITLDIIQIPLGNSGGHLAHLGGALIGFVYTRQFRKGHDIVNWPLKIIDAFVQIFKTKKKPLRTAYKSTYKKETAASSKKAKEEYQKKIDVILDKISKSGYDSLTREEKNFLFRAGKE